VEFRGSRGLFLVNPDSKKFKVNPGNLPSQQTAFQSIGFLYKLKARL
jgi:hypothetical protein